MEITIKEKDLEFKIPGGTSRGVLKSKPSWFIMIKDEDNLGIGECSLIPGLSPDDPSLINKVFEGLKQQGELSDNSSEFKNFPAIRFAIEKSLLSLKNKSDQILFNSAFLNGTGIPINGLIWMGEKGFMLNQIKEKLNSGFNCIKIKVGAIDLEDELSLLKYIRREFTGQELELRLDANGAFSADGALDKLNRLSDFDIHSIEQPIQAGQIEAMAGLCQTSPIPIALDEELIGVYDESAKINLLKSINPQYIILKPSLLGGFAASEEWIRIAEDKNIAWWVTSALESNIGLNAIAQWTSTLGNNLPQGLGTGQVFANNFNSPLEMKNGYLYYNSNKEWDLSFFTSK